MDKFWNFMYFCAGGIFTTFIVKYVCQVLIVKYGGKNCMKDDEDE